MKLLLSGKVFWVSITYRYKNWKKDDEYRELQFNYPEYVMCVCGVCITDKTISLDFSGMWTISKKGN